MYKYDNTTNRFPSNLSSYQDGKLTLLTNTMDFTLFSREIAEDQLVKIDFIHESIFQIGNVELIKSVMNTPHFNAEYACEDSDSCFSKIVDSKNEDLVLMMLTKYERDVNSVNKDGTALVIKAVENDTPQISSLFIQRSCDMTVKTPTGETLLQMCIEKRWYLHVTYILANGYTALNNDEHYFHHMCHLSIINDSTLIFDKLIKHYFSTKLQRAWRRRMQQSTISH